ncbi:MAG: heavy metal translocating P-type ATPase, partial [Treponema sp.]|nr:heavy metal translocating P-type ATPase [Treponema sp.]
TGKIFSADTLDATALTLSYATGDLNTAGSIALLLNMGDTLEDYTKRKSYDSLASSLLTTDEMVQVVQDDGEEVAVSVSLLKAGDIVISRAGSVIPVDGTVVSGEAMVNQASMTGESLPVHKEKDSSVFASTIVEEGEIRIQVKQAGGETKVNKIVALIDQSQELKAASQVRAERIADRLVRYNFLLAGLTYLVTRNFTKAASTLLVDYSCAMKLSAPICVLSAMRDSAKKGIMAKGGKYLEELAKADVVVFDKTGTLTESTPKVTNVIPFGKHKEEEVLKLAACLEEHFPHSLARAVVKEAADRGIDHMEEHAKVEYVLAHGIASSLNGTKLRIGSAHFIFDDEKIKKTKEAQKVIDEYAETGSSLLYFSIGNSLAGIIVIQDPIRDESVRAVAELKRLGVKKIVMITGDGENTARIIAKKSGVDEYISQALPDTKVEFIKKMQAEGHKVVMVGDGINDAPALSAADVGIAMGAASQIAAQTADIILPDDGLSSLPELRQIGLNLMSRISGNNAAIVAINTTLIALGLAGVVSSSTAALFHNSSTVAISMNAM